MCEESKRRVLPEWHRIEVTEDTIDSWVMETPYMKGVLSRGEYVKATEFGRLWALCRYGGVYMDEDVEALKPLDSLLADPFFIGYEDQITLNGAVIGSIPFGKCITFVGSNFPLACDGTLKATIYGPQYLTAMLDRRDECKRYPPEYFYPIHYNGSGAITENSYTNHHWAGSWKGQGNGS